MTIAWNEITVNLSKNILDLIWSKLSQYDYIVSKFADLGVLVKYERPLEHVMIKKYPAIALMDNTEIDFSFESFSPSRTNNEIFYLEIMEQGNTWELAKNKAKLVMNNIISMIDILQANGDSLFEKIDLLQLRNNDGREIAPKLWNYTITLTFRVIYTNIIYE